jgi:hypothetical protein
MTKTYQHVKADSRANANPRLSPMVGGKNRGGRRSSAPQFREFREGIARALEDYRNSEPNDPYKLCKGRSIEEHKSDNPYTEFYVGAIDWKGKRCDRLGDEKSDPARPSRC